MTHTNDSFPLLYTGSWSSIFWLSCCRRPRRPQRPRPFNVLFKPISRNFVRGSTPEDAPRTPRPVFPLFDECTMDETSDITSVRFSPEGEAFFRAWVRRQAVLTDTGLSINSGRSH